MLIEKAASRVRGDRLRGLRYLCETQKNVSTAKLLKYVEDLEESDRLDGMHFKALADYLS